MKKICCKSFTLLLGLIGLLDNVVEVKGYKAAVVAYKPLENERWTPDDIVKQNVQNCVQKISNSKGRAEIIVFPEFAFSTADALNKAKDHLADYSMVLDKEQSNPCANSENKDPNLVALSCAAKSAGIQVVFNVVERQNSSYYLTSVVLKSDGSIALKCRRNNLPPNTSYSKDSTQGSCMFSANFANGKSQLLVSHDPGLLNKIPAEVDTVILTSAVVNSLPFNYAPSFHAGFAVRNKVNLLVAGYFDLNNNYGGSGIYNIDGDRLIADAVLGSASASETDFILYKDVNVVAKKADVSIRVNVGFENLQTVTFPYQNVSTVPVNNKYYNQCIDGICCDFKASVTGTNIDPYRWVAHRSKMTLFYREVDVINCALIKPGNTEAMAFQNVTITSKYEKSEILQVIPVAVKNNFVIPLYDYLETDSYSTLNLGKQEEIISFGIVHVLRDSTNSANKISPLVPSCLLVVLVVLLGR